MAIQLNQPATPLRTPKNPSLPATATSASSAGAKVVSALQIGVALLSALLVLLTPFAWFKFHGYGAFAIGFNENATTSLLAVVIAITGVFVAWTAYMWGWKSSTAAAKFARISLIASAWEWIWLFSLVVDVWNRIDYHATFAFEGYRWWLGTASYSAIIATVVLTVLGVVAVQLARPNPSPRTQ